MNLAHDEKDAKGERERFEAWCFEDDTRVISSDYGDPRTNAAWDAWQSARADTARIVAEAVAKERLRCEALCDDIAWMVERGAGETEPGGRLIQVKENIHHGKTPGNWRARSAQPDAGDPRDTTS